MEFPDVLSFVGHTTHRESVGLLDNVDTLFALKLLLLHWQSCPAGLTVSALLLSPAFQAIKIASRIFILCIANS